MALGADTEVRAWAAPHPTRASAGGHHTRRGARAAARPAGQTTARPRDLEDQTSKSAAAGLFAAKYTFIPTAVSSRVTTLVICFAILLPPCAAVSGL